MPQFSAQNRVPILTCLLAGGVAGAAHSVSASRSGNYRLNGTRGDLPAVENTSSRLYDLLENRLPERACACKRCAMPVLRIHRQQEGPRIEPLGEERIVIGRSRSADIRVRDPKVSKHHALLVRAGKHYLLVDLKSRNGTFVNGVRVAHAQLNPGDEILLGGVRLVYESTGEEIPKAAPARRKPLKTLLKARQLASTRTSARFGLLFAVVFLTSLVVVLAVLRSHRDRRPGRPAPRGVAAPQERTPRVKGASPVAQTKPLLPPRREKKAQQAAVPKDPWPRLVLEAFFQRQAPGAERLLAAACKELPPDVAGTLPLLLPVAQAARRSGGGIFSTDGPGLFRMFLKRTPEAWEREAIENAVAEGAGPFELACAFASTPECRFSGKLPALAPPSHRAATLVLVDAGSVACRDLFCDAASSESVRLCARRGILALRLTSTPQDLFTAALGLLREAAATPRASAGSGHGKVWFVYQGSHKPLPEAFSDLSQKAEIRPASLHSLPACAKFLSYFKKQGALRSDTLQRICTLRSELSVPVHNLERLLAEVVTGRTGAEYELFLETVLTVLQVRRPSLLIALTGAGKAQRGGTSCSPTSRAGTLLERLGAVVPGGGTLVYAAPFGSQGREEGFFLAAGSVFKNARVFKGPYTWQDLCEIILHAGGYKKETHGARVAQVFAR